MLQISHSNAGLCHKLASHSPVIACIATFGRAIVGSIRRFGNHKRINGAYVRSLLGDNKAHDLVTVRTLDQSIGLWYAEVCLGDDNYTLSV